jgi:hypothetical protein
MKVNVGLLFGIVLLYFVSGTEAFWLWFVMVFFPLAYFVKKLVLSVFCPYNLCHTHLFIKLDVALFVFFTGIFFAANLEISQILYLVFGYVLFWVSNRITFWKFWINHYCR